MDIMEAKQLVIKAGIEVVEYGLIARTWGNISCRVDDKRFVITPSGRPYETLTPDEIVVVNIDDCSYEGDIKPSSEKGIHAEAYRLRPEVNFVIHTHQMQASVISALGMDINEVEPASAEIVGDNVPIAAYGLPGTGKLRKGVVEAIKRSDSKAVIMAKNRYHLITGKVAETLGDVAEYIGTLFDSSAKEAPVFEPCNSERDGSVFNISAVDGDGSIVRIDIKTGELVAGNDYPASAEMHRAIYKKRKDVNFIMHTKTPAEVAMSKSGKTMKPLLDDFAQLVGATVRSVTFNPNSTKKTAKKVVKALKGRNGVLLNNNGALCVSGSEYDAAAVEMVMDKGCKTAVGARLFEAGKPINPIETRLMRFIYLKKYSKQAKK